jgi:hypothetical protein
VYGPKYLEPGIKFGRLIVVKVDETSKRKNNKSITSSEWKCKCKCSCPEQKVVSISRISLCRGETKSCGCIRKERVLQMNFGKRKVNPIEREGSIVKIFFFKHPNEYTVVNTEDYDKVKGFCWYKDTATSNLTYASANSHGLFKTQDIKIHQIICPCEEGFEPDHCNGNGLDNRKENLRPLTHRYNMRNTKRQENNRSGVTGIYWSKNNQRWIVQITTEDAQLYVSSYKEFKEAVLARYLAEKEFFGENTRNWDEKYADNPEILALLPWLEKEYEKIPNTP